MKPAAGVAADTLLGELARSSRGLIAHEAAAAAGVTARQLDYRIKKGVLIRVHPGVSRLAAVEPTWEQKQLAACLWAGRGWIASGLGAAALWELEGLEARRVEISGAGRISQTPSGITVHERCIFLPGDATTVKGIPATSAARTIIDLPSRVHDERRLERAFESAIRLGLLTPEFLMRRMRRLGTKGRKRITKLVEILVRRGDAPPSDSDFEVLLSQVLRDGGLPPPVRQRDVHDAEGFIARVDFMYPLAKLILEADSFKHHGGRADWENDNSKRRRLVALGYRILPITWRMVVSDPHQVQSLVRRSLHPSTP